MFVLQDAVSAKMWFVATVCVEQKLPLRTYVAIGGNLKIEISYFFAVCGIFGILFLFLSFNCFLDIRICWLYPIDGIRIFCLFSSFWFHYFRMDRCIALKRLS